ncbi:MAG: hypothetical protein JST23_07360 [Bacteroidetes bacterium]|nr:hypothetical protein [Bacteroidota bacterium]
MNETLEFYKKSIAALNDALKELKQTKRKIAWSRFFSMALTIAVAWFLWQWGAAIVIPVILIGLTVFLFFVRKDAAKSNEIQNHQRLIAINETEIQILNHQYLHLSDGAPFLPKDHPCANDLDFFGKASLYQFINRTETEQGNELLSEQFLFPEMNVPIIQAKQEAIKELEKHTEWRQQLQAHLLPDKVTLKMQHNIKEWMNQKQQFIAQPKWELLRFLLPTISFGLLFLHLFDILSAAVFYPLITVMLLLSLLITKKIMNQWLQVSKISPQLNVLSNSIAHIQNSRFKSPLLQQSVLHFKTKEKDAAQSIKKLERILDMLDIRLNPLLFLPLNTFLFWDLQQVFALEKWKKNQSAETDKWFSSLATLETLSSFATFSFNHPNWIYPVFTNEEGVFAANNIGHPLIPEQKSVLNSFSTNGNGIINIVTGSNMAGKSTFLRSVGCNITLALAGAPVCASYMQLTPMQIMSSMRISDNLEESTSTFYAELKKLKSIIEAVKERKPLFLLLDEILRGTNSADRHTGSKALIKQLVLNDAAGIVATHDIELTNLSQEYPNGIHNYHFDVQVTGEELYFDYKLKPGVCQSMNASLLMKKIGIEI